MHDARDALDLVWHAMHEDRQYADAVRAAVCVWAGCDDCCIEQDGDVWVSGDAPRHIADHEAEDLVRHLSRAYLLRGVVS